MDENTMAPNDDLIQDTPSIPLTIHERVDVDEQASGDIIPLLTPSPIDPLAEPFDIGARAPAAPAPLKKKAPATLFEIGVVYRKNSRYYLAVSERTLITFKNGEVQEIRPYARYDVVRSISVEELCQKWGISLDHLDGVTAKYLAPSAEGVKPRPRGSRRQRAADELAWRCLRTIRLLAG
jgi:hypothetical protein